MSKSVSRNLVILHLTVMVWGFTGILGELITIRATHLVWYRVLIAFCTLFAYFKIAKKDIRVDTTTFLKLFFTGALVGLHWVLFFHCIKLSTVSVALVCLSSITLFTSILEPIINRAKTSGLEVFTGLMIVCGILMIFTFERTYTLGIIYGLISAVCASLFSIINSKQIQNRPAPVISFYELLGAWAWISIYLFASGGFSKEMMLKTADLFYLLILGTICTSLAYVAGVSVMKELSAFRVALITNLEPIYGIILAFLFFGKKEQMTPGFYAGSLVVLGAVFLYPILRSKFVNRKLNKQIPIGQEQFPRL